MSASPTQTWSGRTVVVTGASSGIGRACAVALDAEGAGVVVCGRNEARLQETVGQLTRPPTAVLRLDLRDTDAIAGAVQGLVADHGRLYGLCHCAGAVETRPLSAFRASHLAEMLSVNLTAGLELARVITRRDVMVEDGGALVFVSSIYALVGKPGQVAYTASKGAITAATRSMAVELARRRIRVNSVSPGLVHTPLADHALAALTEAQVAELEASHPLGPGRPEDVARAAVFLLHPENRWITGTDLIIDGGYTAR